MQIKNRASRARTDDSARFRLSPGALQMMDIIMLALGLAFFALSVGYTIACDRL
jgi:CelD/BcsL family acetyltransferase involved in cellulose biosynthesis